MAGSGLGSALGGAGGAVGAVGAEGGAEGGADGGEGVLGAAPADAACCLALAPAGGRGQQQEMSAGLLLGADLGTSVRRGGPAGVQAQREHCTATHAGWAHGRAGHARAARAAFPLPVVLRAPAPLLRPILRHPRHAPHSHWMLVTHMVLMMSGTVQPRDRSFTGLARP